MTNCVLSEAEIIEAVKQGLEDIKAERLISNEEVVHKSEEILAEARRQELQKS